MKAKRLKREIREALRDMIRPMFTKLCMLPLKTRAVLAWQLLRGDDDLDKANRRVGGNV